MTNLADQLVGDWDLLEWQTATLDGEFLDHPFGPDAVGILSLSPQVLHVQMMRNGRPAFSTQVVTAADRCGRNPDEVTEAFGTYMAYTGAWSLDGDQLSTTVEAGLIPEWAGSRQTRTVTIEGNHLRLRSLPRTIGGIDQVGTLDWRRRQPAGSG